MMGKLCVAVLCGSVGFDEVVVGVVWLLRGWDVRRWWGAVLLLTAVVHGVVLPVCMLGVIHVLAKHIH